MADEAVAAASGGGRIPELDLHSSGQFDEVAGRIRWSREHRHLFD